jgi:hypothetical protein
MYSVELNNIVISSRDTTLLKQILLKIELTGINQGVGR